MLILAILAGCILWVTVIGGGALFAARDHSYEATAKRHRKGGIVLWLAILAIPVLFGAPSFLLLILVPVAVIVGFAAACIKLLNWRDERYSERLMVKLSARG